MTSTASIDIGSRRELLVDDALIDTMQGAELLLHRPVPSDVAIVHDQPWEGNVCFYHTVFRDRDRLRMYYRGAHYDEQTRTIDHQVVCYAESSNGLTWSKPDLGLVAFHGSTRNNIIWDGLGAHNFAPFLDANPACAPAQKYKALASGEGGLYAFHSPDGLRWPLMREQPVITEGAFDSQNLAFWDPNQRCYADYHRHFYPHDGEDIRGIMTCTSADFLTWTRPTWLEYPGAPIEHLYTNQALPYYRAPQLYMGFPKRFVPTRHPSDHQYSGVSDVVFMTSRDGRRFHRWGEALIRPGLQRERWENRNNFVAHGIVETASGIPDTPGELSLYSIEGYYRGASCQMRRYTLRLDGFVSAHAPLRGGEFTTKPLVFAGDRLLFNMSTSAAGSVRVELQDAERTPIPGFSLADCDDIYGDAIEKPITWRGAGDLGALSGRPIRLRVMLSDADVFAYRFG